MTTGEAVAYLAQRGYRFSKKRIRKWAEKGWIDNAVKPPGEHWQISADSLDRFISQHMPSRRRKNSAIRAIRAVSPQNQD